MADRSAARVVELPPDKAAIAKEVGERQDARVGRGADRTIGQDVAQGPEGPAVVGHYGELAVELHYGIRTTWDQYYERGADPGWDGVYRGWKVGVRTRVLTNRRYQDLLIGALVDPETGTVVRGWRETVRLCDLWIHCLWNPGRPGQVVIRGWTASWYFERFSSHAGHLPILDTRLLEPEYLDDPDDLIRIAIRPGSE